jgi:hypothetical protein
MGCLSPSDAPYASPEVLVPVANLVPRRGPSQALKFTRFMEWKNIGILVKRRISDVKSKGGIDTLRLAEHPHSKHPREVARSPIRRKWCFADRLLSMRSGNASLLVESDLDCGEQPAFYI